MEQKIYIIDAFSDGVFTGNPAAVCILQNWLPEETMQNIAMENNLAETAFLVEKNQSFEIRWFTPTCEVDLCGHATLASAFVLFEYGDYQNDKIEFLTKKSGVLTVSKDQDLLILDFPKDDVLPSEMDFKNCFAYQPKEIYKGKTDYLLVFEDESQIQNIEPNFNELKKIEARGFIVTSKSKNYDFVSRFFAPQTGIDEDPVTGSSFTTLTPYWSKILNKNKLMAKQISKRGGIVSTEVKDQRVLIGGKCSTYLIGIIYF